MAIFGCPVLAVGESSRAENLQVISRRRKKVTCNFSELKLSPTARTGHPKMAILALFAISSKSTLFEQKSILAPKNASKR